jgi:hypothetical protein
MLRHDAFDAWMTAYGAAWLSNDAEDVAALFAEEATEPMRDGASPTRSGTTAASSVLD